MLQLYYAQIASDSFPLCAHGSFQLQFQLRPIDHRLSPPYEFAPYLSYAPPVASDDGDWCVLMFRPSYQFDDDDLAVNMTHNARLQFTLNVRAQNGTLTRFVDSVYATKRYNGVRETKRCVGT
jgi:hypothetical protein